MLFIKSIIKTNNKIPFWFALFISIIFVCCGERNKNYLDCKSYQNIERERMRSNKVKTIIGICVLEYNFEEEKIIPVYDTSFISKFDTFGNLIELKEWYSKTSYQSKIYEYDQYGRLKYYKFIPLKEIKSLPLFEQIYFYENETSCNKQYSLKFDLEETRKLTDSIVYNYSYDTVLSQTYRQNEEKEWREVGNDWKIVDLEFGVTIKHYPDDIEKKYEFSPDNKMLSIIFKPNFSSGERKIENIYDGDLILESNFYKFTPEDSLLISTRKYFYEYY